MYTPAYTSYERARVDVSGINIPNGTILVGIIHSHGAESLDFHDERFSKSDKNVAGWYGVPLFVTTPQGSIFKFNPNNIFNRTTTLTLEGLKGL